MQGSVQEMVSVHQGEHGVEPVVITEMKGMPQPNT